MMNKGLNTVTLDTLYASGIQLTEEQYTFDELISYARELAVDKMVVADVEKELYFIERDHYESELVRLIKRLDRFVPPTESQIETATNLCNECKVPVPEITLDHDKRWFSALISAGIAKVSMLPPTEDQLRTLENMSYCPDFDKFTGTTRGEASEYIKQNSKAYAPWTRTRARYEYIKQLMELAKTCNLSEKEQSYAYCHQFTQAEIKHEIARLEEKAKAIEEQQLATAVNYFDQMEINRQDFHNQIEDKRKAAYKGLQLEKAARLQAMKQDEK